MKACKRQLARLLSYSCRCRIVVAAVLPVVIAMINNSNRLWGSNWPPPHTPLFIAKTNNMGKLQPAASKEKQNNNNKKMKTKSYSEQQ